MVSDVLHDALAGIERYQTDFPDAYDPLKQEIESVKTVMAGLLACLDAAPGIIEEQDRLVGDLRAAIRNLDVSGVLAGRQRFLSWVERTRQKAKCWAEEAGETGILPMKMESDEGGSELYQSLIHVEIPRSLSSHEVVDCYLRATMVAAGIHIDKEFFQGIMGQLRAKAAAESASITSPAGKRARQKKGGTTDGR